MKRQEKNEIYSIRKFKVGVGSALIGLSFLGATGLVNDVPVLGDMFGFETAHADQNSYSVPVYKDGNYIGQGEVWGAAGGLTYRGNVPQGYRIGSVSSSAVYLVKETTNGGSSFDTIGRDSTSYAPTKPDREYTEPESVITYEVTYEADDSKPVGQRYTKTEGRNGAKRAYVDHVRTSGSSIATLVNGVEIIREPVNSVIAIGTAPTVTKTPINFKTVYEKDATRDKGQPNVTKTEGMNGAIVSTVRHTVNSSTGDVTDLPATESKTEPTNKVVKVAAKDKVETKEIPAKVRYVGDETKDKGSEPVRTEGKKGKEVTTTVYTVNPKTGEITEQTSTKRTEEPTETVVKVGAKSKVETIRKNGDTIERTTKYKVNAETGEITEEVIDKLIASNGNGIKPPVVENNDFNVGVNGDADGSALINEKPEFDLSTLKNADLGTGLNDFGPKKDTKKDDLQFIPVNDSGNNNSDNGFKRSGKPVSEKPASQLPNTAGGKNVVINALGALTLTSVLGLAATKRKKEEN